MIHHPDTLYRKGVALDFLPCAGMLVTFGRATFAVREVAWLYNDHGFGLFSVTLDPHGYQSASECHAALQECGFTARAEESE